MDFESILVQKWNNLQGGQVHYTDDAAEASHDRWRSSPSLSLVFLLPLDAMHKRGLCRCAVYVRLSVCLSVCLSRSCIVSKRLIVSSNFFQRRIATLF